MILFPFFLYFPNLPFIHHRGVVLRGVVWRRLFMLAVSYGTVRLSHEFKLCPGPQSLFPPSIRALTSFWFQSASTKEGFILRAKYFGFYPLIVFPRLLAHRSPIGTFAD